MTGAVDEAAEFGRDVGVEVARTARNLRTKGHRFFRRARWFDGTALVLLLLLACCGGIWWPWAAAIFATSLTVDLIMCRKLDPDRSPKGAAS